MSGAIDRSGGGPLPPAFVAGRAGFLLDLNRCVGCGACVLACRIENDLPDTVSWRRILPLNLRRKGRGPTYFFSLACHHCEAPPCARGCPSGALEQRSDGVVYLHTDRCLGCRYCEMACPFGAPAFDEARAVMTKCHLCLHRQEQGQLPACVEACPTRALHFEAPGAPAEIRIEPEAGGPAGAFAKAGEVPGFAAPGKADPNLRLSPPRDGIRGKLYEGLRERLAGKGRGSP